MSEPGAVGAPRWLRATVVVLSALTIAVAWGSRLSWGLWLDETFVAWQAEAGWSIARDKLGDPAQSVLFGYLEALFYFPGSPHMEAWLRVPALIGGLISCWLAGRLAERLVGAGTGLLAFVAMVGSAQMVVSSTQARPYTCAVAACLGSLWGLLRWVETRRRRHAATFAIGLALAVHLHLLFATFAVVPAFYLWQRARSGQHVDWRGLLRWLGLTAALLLPLLPLLRRMSQGANPSAIRLMSLGSALGELVPVTVLLSLVAFAFLLVPNRRIAAAAVRAALDRAPLELAAFWLLVPPLLLLVASHLTHRTLFLDRYFVHTVAAQALIVAVLFRGLPTAPSTLVLMACLFTTPVLYGVRTWSQPDQIASWRPPFRAIRQLDPRGAAPVFVSSGHPPSNAADWQHGIERRLFFYSQVVAYPVPNHVYPLPYDVDAAMQAYVATLADRELANAPLIFVTGGSATGEWMRRFFEARGYAASYPLHNEGFWLMALRRPADGPS